MFASTASRFSRKSEVQSDQRLQSCVFLELLIGVQDGVSFFPFLSTSICIPSEDVDLPVAGPLLQWWV